ncbi:tRNA cyclic N6-threonylcarbamoyladenosine(37) synthase TcdA [Parendozoicomonas haliclonae]|uniref:tRNA threonylcarbamoyladenosine dehydratase n=1 Tax=Parendozoicomonas haliclonae TaxID=1960125 RepID=A0A1X7AFK1_9GAMM|nr:tRNA cyclic N6-threonylcarbamoyladenosine(37) synthase TcdA [Parendozoicomonas haliclonae]SMA38000.1 tRNA threonylcarbamoyladenosine dehydratase [Parendozoicomonas haliclonae]
MSYSSRFGGIQRLYGQPVSEALHNAHICVIGIGGVGSWAAEALARTGVGTVTLIDLDDICVTNTNRQIHALKETIGQSKTQVMAERMLAINPDMTVHQIEDFVTEDNVAEYLGKHFDYVLDAIDAFRVKAAIIAHCKRQKIPVITVGGAGGLVDPLKIRVADLTKTFQDPLAKKVKDFLRYRYNFSKNTKRRFAVECVFSEEAARYPQPDGSVCEKKPGAEGESMKMDCSSGFGAATMVTATFGFVAVSRIIEKLTQKMNR